jgi:hypothetical protein
MKAWVAVALLLLGHLFGLREVFGALDYAAAASRKAYTDIAPHLDRLGRDIRQEYQEAQHGSQR